MTMPTRFKLGLFTITVRFVEKLDDNSFGSFSEADNVITIAKTVECEDRVITLAQDQLDNTFWHEVFHAFQFYYNNEFIESQAQVYANFMCQLMNE